METKPRLSRRDLLRSGSTVMAGAALGGLRLPSVGQTVTRTTGRDVLLCIFLRGAADGLNIVVPHGEAEYYQRRSTLAIPQPGQGADAALDLDGFFGLHPALDSFKRLYDAQVLAAVHACGSPDPTHSHFDGMDFMERGLPGDRGTFTGWLGRHLQATAGSNDSPMRAVGLGGSVQTSLRGPVAAVAISSIANFHLKERQVDPNVVEAALRELYGSMGALSGVAGQTFTVLDQIAPRLKPDYAPAPGARYPNTRLGQMLKEFAQLVKGDLGLEVACADFGGWDTHANQGGVKGAMATLLSELGQSLEAVVTDLADHLDRLTIVTMSEFGRRVQENGSKGTDHGHGNCMFVLGGNVHGGKVHGQWPGLQREQLYGPGDLQVTTDFRDVLGEIVQARLGNSAIDQVFPNYQPQSLGILKSG